MSLSMSSSCPVLAFSDAIKLTSIGDLFSTTTEKKGKGGGGIGGVGENFVHSGSDLRRVCSSEERSEAEKGVLVVSSKGVG